MKEAGRKSSRGEDEDLLEIASSVGLEVYNPNEYVFRQGDQGSKFYILLSGTLVGLLEPPKSLTNNIKRLEQSREIFKLQPGDFFGEVALKNSASRNCSVIALETSACAILSKADFLKVVGEEASMKSFSDIFQFLRSTENFRDYPEDVIYHFSTKLMQTSKSTGEVLIQQGTNCLQMFILKSGHVSMMRRIDFNAIEFEKLSKISRTRFEELAKGNLEVEISVKSKVGDVFCYYEILNKIDSNYKIVAKIPSKFYYCSASDFYQVFTKNGLENLKSNDHYIPSDLILLQHHIDAQLWNDYCDETSKHILKQREMERKRAEYQESTVERSIRLSSMQKSADLKGYFKSKFMKLRVLGEIPSEPEGEFSKRPPFHIKKPTRKNTSNIILKSSNITSSSNLMNKIRKTIPASSVITNEYRIVREYGSLCRMHMKMDSIGERFNDNDRFINSLVNNQAHSIIHKTWRRHHQRYNSSEDRNLKYNKAETDRGSREKKDISEEDRSLQEAVKSYIQKNKQIFNFSKEKDMNCFLTYLRSQRTPK